MKTTAGKQLEKIYRIGMQAFQFVPSYALKRLCFIAIGTKAIFFSYALVQHRFRKD